jgi:hypothetical protein
MLKVRAVMEVAMCGHIKHGSLVLLLVNVALAQGQATQPVNEYRPGGYPENYGGVFYSGTELRALPAARAQAVAARAEFRRAQTNLDNAISDIRRAFFRSGRFVEAQAQEQAAWDAFVAARGRALADLRSDSAYLAAVDLRAQLARQIEQIRQDNEHRAAHLLALSTVKLSYSATASAMETAAIAADPVVAEARQRLLVAARQLSELYQEFDDIVRSSPVVQAERRRMQDARVAVAATDALYIEAHNVAEAAMDYAYHIYDHPYPYVINSPYYSGSYTHPVGYPIGYPINWWRGDRKN